VEPAGQDRSEAAGITVNNQRVGSAAIISDPHRRRHGGELDHVVEPGQRVAEVLEGPPPPALGMRVSVENMNSPGPHPCPPGALTFRIIPRCLAGRPMAAAMCADGDAMRVFGGTIDPVVMARRRADAVDRGSGRRC